MTLSTIATRVSYAGNGATTSFAFAFKIWAASDLKVYLRDIASLADTLQVLTTDYTVTGALPGTGNVVFVTAPAAGKTVVILRDAGPTQDLDLIANGAFAAENIEQQFDKVTGMVQSLLERINRSLLLPIGTALANLVLPEPTVAKAKQVIAVNDTGDGYALIAQTNIAVATVSSYIATLVVAATAAAARLTLGLQSLRATGLTFNPGSLANNAEVESGNLSVPGAAFGDQVDVFPPYDLQGFNCWGYVKVADNVRIRLRNGTGGAINPGNSSAWEVRVNKGGQA